MAIDSRPPPVPQLPSYTDTGDRTRFMSDEERVNLEGKKDVDTSRKVGVFALNPLIYSNPVTAVGAYALSKWDRLKTGKGQEQQMRDKVRDFLWDNGAVDSDWKLKFSDGSAFDIGKDGDNKLKNTSGKERSYWEPDDTNPFTKEAIAKVSPLAALITNNDERLKQQFAGYFTNAATQDAKDPGQVDKRISEMYGMIGITKSAGLRSLQELQAQGRISQEQFGQYSSLVSKYAPDEDPRSFVDAFLPAGSYANKIARNAVNKMQAKMGVDFSPYDNINEFSLPTTYFSVPAYATQQTPQTQQVATPVQQPTQNQTLISRPQIVPIPGKTNV